MGSYGLRWIISGWWLKTTYPFEKYMTSSIGMMTIPTEWEHKKWSEPPTSFCLPCSSMLNYGSNETSLPEKMSCLRKHACMFPYHPSCWGETNAWETRFVAPWPAPH